MGIGFLIVAVISIIVFVWLLIIILKKLVDFIPFRSFEWMMAATYFRSNKNKGFISLISTISIIGMVLGCAAIIMASSFMNGMMDEVEKRTISGESHIKVRGFLDRLVTDYDATVTKIKQLPEVESASPKIFNYALIGKNFKAKSYPVIINGIDVNNQNETTDISTKIISGEFNLMKHDIKSENSDRVISVYGIVLGKYLADDLNLTSLDIGSRIVVAAIPKKIDFEVTLKLQQFYFAGIVDMGFPQYDQTFAFTHFLAAQELFQINPADASYISVRLKDINTLDQVDKSIEKMLDYPLTTDTWREEWRATFEIQQWEKKVYQIALALIICLAAFNILSTLYMMVKDKTREIGVLRSLGSSSRAIMKIFINQGLLIGILGAIGGLILGLTAVHLQDQFHLIHFPKNTLILDYLPVVIDYYEVFTTALFTIIIAGLAGIFPAFKAAKLNPVEAFRYE